MSERVEQIRHQWKDATIPQGSTVQSAGHCIGHLLAHITALEQAVRETERAYRPLLDYCVERQAAHHSTVCDCGLCCSIAAIRARSNE